MDTEGSLACPQKLITGPYPESVHSPTKIIQIGLPSALFSWDFLIHILYTFTFSAGPLHAPPVSFSLV
jgi:hypothetical protein